MINVKFGVLMGGRKVPFSLSPLLPSEVFHITAINSKSE